MSIAKPFNNLSVMKKTMLSPLIITLTILIVSIYIGLNSPIDTVDTVVNDLTPDIDTTSKMMGKIYEKRIQVKNYIKTSEDTAKEKFTLFADELNDLISKSKINIKHPDRKKLVLDIEKIDKEYDDAFYNIVVKEMDVRNKIVTSIMNKEGPSAEKNLTLIMKSAYEDGDSDAEFFGGETLRTLLLARLYAFKYLNDNSEASKSRTFSELKKTEQAISKLLLNLENENRRKNANAVLSGLSAYTAGFEQVTKAIENRNKAINNILDIKGPQIAEKVKILKASILNSLENEGRKIEATLHKAETDTTISYIIYILVALLGLATSFALAKGIVNPISKISSGIDNVAQGDLTVAIDVAGKDELGRLANRFNIFVSEIRELIESIASTTETLSTAAASTSLITQETSQNILQQQNETAHVATAVNEMTASVREVENNTEQASRSASDGNTQAKAGREVINGIVISIEQLVSEIVTSSNIILKLKEDSTSIGGILDVIKNIAEQTNLLALNAAIEAARAGEQGRGFAVVADEVRSLAQKTQESTKQIETLITTLQENADSAAASMTANKESVTSLSARTTVATESLNTISTAVSSISDMNAQIATSAEEQSTVVEELNRNLHNIKSIADTTSLASEKVLAASEEVAVLSRDLKSLVMRFKLR